jgi:hypothetical protein
MTNKMTLRQRIINLIHCLVLCRLDDHGWIEMEDAYHVMCMYCGESYVEEVDDA